MPTEAFRTPRGRSVNMEFRDGTNDWNTLSSCLTEDEYRLRGLHLSGYALDIGAHIGGVTVALAADNPELKIVAIEPVPNNVELLVRNLKANSLTDQVIVVEAAAGNGDEVDIRYGYSGSEVACHHAYIGNLSLIGEPGPENPHTVRRMRSLTLEVLPAAQFSFAKIDCEGCEWDIDLSAVPHVRGEWHPVRGHVQADVLDRFPLHAVTFSGPLEGPGGFEAVQHA